MNAYYVDGGMYESISWDPPDCERYRLAGIFCAETPGQAKWDALREFNNACEYRDFKVRLLAKGLDLPRGVFDEALPDGPWEEDENVDPPEPWLTIWAALDRVYAQVPLDVLEALEEALGE